MSEGNILRAYKSRLIRTSTQSTLPETIALVLYFLCFYFLDKILETDFSSSSSYTVSYAGLLEYAVALLLFVS